MADARLAGEIELGLLLTSVVLVAEDLACLAVLLLVDLCFFLRRQFAAIGGAVIADFLVDARLIFLQMRAFTGGQLSALHALRDAVLLVFLALANFALRRRIRRNTLGHNWHRQHHQGILNKEFFN